MPFGSESTITYAIDISREHDNKLLLNQCGNSLILLFMITKLIKMNKKCF